MIRSSYFFSVALTCLLINTDVQAEVIGEASNSELTNFKIVKGQGEALFVEKCAMCHREKGMGTGLLARRIEPAMLEQRENLTTEFVVLMARQGVGNMPRISRGEVSDDQLKAIGDYLSRTVVKKKK